MVGAKGQRPGSVKTDMKSLSIGAAWLESSVFLKREMGLLLPVVLLFIGVPFALLLGAIPQEFRTMAEGGAIPQNVTVPGLSLIAFLLCPLVMIGGTLATYALALQPGISLREALGLGFRRIPVALGAAVLVGLVLIVPSMAARMASPQGGSLVMMIFLFWLSARLLPLNALVVDRPVGVIAALRESWALSRGMLLRLLAFLIVISIPLMIVQTVGQIVFGLVGVAIGGQEGGRQLGDVGSALALALGQMVMIVMTANIYRQMVAGRS